MITYNRISFLLDSVSDNAYTIIAWDFVGQKVFARFEGVTWPGIVEDPSNVLQTVTRLNCAVFLYGIHER